MKRIALIAAGLLFAWSSSASADLIQLTDTVVIFAGGSVTSTTTVLTANSAMNSVSFTLDQTLPVRTDLGPPNKQRSSLS
jgi:hypothetical protein